MIQGKAFYLKVRKQGVRWGCPCCQPAGRGTSALQRQVLARLIRRREQVEDRLIERIEQIEQQPEE